LSKSQTAHLDVAGDSASALRADLVLTGVEQAGASYEGHVFVGNPEATDSTERSRDQGYVGSFSLYGYGDAAPPEMAAAKARRAEGDPAVAPIEKRLRVDGDLLRDVLARHPDPMVTVVAVPADPGAVVQLPLFERVELAPA
jgi:hypothetical protein